MTSSAAEKYALAASPAVEEEEGVHSLNCSSGHNDTHRRHHSFVNELGQRLAKIMPARSTLYILVKYAIFFNWALTGFWTIYNSPDYQRNAQIVSEKISSYSDDLDKEYVVYCLICYTITMSCVTFFGLVGACYENFCIVFTFAIGYAIYIVFDIVTNAIFGVPFNVFLVLHELLLILTCSNLFFFAALIRSHTQAVMREARLALELRPKSTLASSSRLGLLQERAATLESIPVR